jgi:hypothetical protein
MKKMDVLATFEQLSSRAEKRNAEMKERRYWPIQSKEGRIPIYGMYDYKTKRYVLSRPFDNLEDIMKEISKMLG